MLETLRVQHYALIDDLEVEFGEGFNVLTGETGAGKSIIIGALNLVLGCRASADAVREGAKQARIDALFRVDAPTARLKALLAEHALSVEDGALLLSRVVTAEGRSRGYVSGNLVNISVLAAVGDELVDIHGQHEHQSLLRQDRQLELLDAYAGVADEVARVGECVAAFREAEREVASLESDDREQLRRIEFLRFEAHEIEQAELEVGEEEELQGRRNLIANAERIFTLAAHATDSLYESDEHAAVAGLDAALNDLHELGGIDERFKEALTELEGVRASLEEISRSLREQTAGLEFDPAELDSVNERLDVIRGLKRKYGNSVEAVLAYREKALEEIEAFESRDRRLEEMKGKRDGLAKEARAVAGALSKKRRAAGARLSKEVTAALQGLGMKGGVFSADLQEGALSATGVDRAEFMLAANPGEKPKPLRHVASGGEISRIMLGLKAVLAHADSIPTLIFDEVDAGVGGRVARNVAAKLGELACSHQTICVTHLAQIVAVAQRHYLVLKQAEGKRTVTKVNRLSGPAREEELARLLDGSVSEVSLEHARALLADSAA